MRENDFSAGSQAQRPDPLRRNLLCGAGALGALALSGCLAPSRPATTVGQGHRYSSFRPGALWFDTAGKPIQAHGGSLIFADGAYYWYGENKEFTTGQTPFESWGIRFYRSTDLYNWDDLGTLIPPDESNPQSPLSPAVYPERPHILFNQRTGKFVCWIKIRGQGAQFRIVMEADRITGPYKMINPQLRPAGMTAGDFDFIQDPHSGRAFMYFEHDHKEVVCIELTEDYRGFTDRYTTHLPGSPPDSREGLACFARKGKIYLTSSGLTGYFPNPSRVAESPDINGPFSDLGLLHVGDRTETSFGSQISDIFQLPGKDAYIALADRWLPDLWYNPKFQSGELSRLVRSAIAKSRAPSRPKLSEAELVAIRHAAQLTKVNTSISRYVWLPISFDGHKPQIKWHDEWRLEDQF